MSVTLGRPLAASLLLLALLVAAALLFAAGLADLSSAQDERDAKADFLARSRTMAQARNVDRNRALHTAPLTVFSESETLAAAKVDALVRRTIVDAGGALLSSQAGVKPDETGAPPGRIEIQAIFEADNIALQRILYSWESGAPLIMVEALDVEPAGAPGGDPQSPLLHATVTLTAFWDVARPPGPGLKAAPSVPAAADPSVAPQLSTHF